MVFLGHVGGDRQAALGFWQRLDHTVGVGAFVPVRDALKPGAHGADNTAADATGAGSRY